MRPGDRGSSVSGSGSGAHAEALARVMGEGGVFLPALLLRSYRELGLGDADFMLLLQLMAFRDTERNDFPTPEELATRLGISPRSVQQQLGRLMKEGFLRIDETLDSVSGIRYERYNWQGWLERAAEWTAEAERSASAPAAPSPRPAAAAAATDLFSVFEQEFGRPLSPMECERISMWLDQDRYSDELIRFALREAVFAGKLHFTYIDRILLEWSRNRVTTPEEARVHSRKFRGGAK